jgi:hypothetical protein
MTNDQDDRTPKVFFGALLLVSLTIQLLSGRALGAKYWWDTIAYFQLAEALRSFDSLRELYSGPFGTVYQHLMPGLPALILLFEKLFGSHLWLAFAISQNVLSAVACVYMATGFSTRISRSGQFAVVVLLAAFPYFTALNNAILTESLTASSVMVMVGIVVRCLDGRIKLHNAVIALLLLGIVGGNLRSYVLLVGAGLSVLTIFWIAGFRRLRLYAITLAAVFVGASLFPAYRAAAGLGFFYPRVDALMLAHANYVNWKFDAKTRNVVEHTVFDRTLLDKLEDETKSLSLDDIVKMVDDLVARGRTRSEALREIKQASWTVRTQSWEVISRQLQLSLASLGFERAATCCSASRMLQKGGFSAENMHKHLQYYYKWNAGLDSGYLSTFDGFTDRYRMMPRYFDKTAIDWYTSRVRPYIVDSPSPRRNLFHFGNITPDILVILGIAGILMLRDWRISAMTGLLMVSVYFPALYAAFVGDNRHSHLLWPIYMVGIIVLLERLRVMLTSYWSAYRSASHETKPLP